MLTPNLQPTLFTTNKVDALDLANTTESIAKLWFNENYLSFDISLVSELQNSEILELTFISKLFKSTLDLETINKLLVKLPKPYAFDYQHVFFNVFSNNWEYLPEEKNEDEIVESYLDNLTVEDDKEEIETIIQNLQDRLK